MRDREITESALARAQLRIGQIVGLIDHQHQIIDGIERDGGRHTIGAVMLLVNLQNTYHLLENERDSLKVKLAGQS